MSDTQYVKYLKYLVIILEEIGFREFHIGGDLLIVYVIENNILRLTRIGTDSQLFK